MSPFVSRLSRGAPAGVLALTILVAGCVTGGGGQATPTPQPTPTPSIPAPASFYLRAWQTQALAPQYTFSWLPMATISGGLFIDGRVAVPAIYPGPLWIGPFASQISEDGIARIVAEAHRLGMLGASGDFTEDIAPGSIVGHIQIAIDGKYFDLAGDPDRLLRCRCIPDPGTAAAFAAFWQQISEMSTWLADEIGPSAPYSPERVAVLATQPVEPQSDIQPGQAAWPLAPPFASFGVEWGGEMRCGVVSGADLALLIPAVKEANQLTRFKDSAGVIRSIQARVVVPGEPSPCE